MQVDCSVDLSGFSDFITLNNNYGVNFRNAIMFYDDNKHDGKT